MTAIIAARQRNSIHVATDAASYFRGGDVACFGVKMFPIANWPGVVTSSGNAAAMSIFALELSARFRNWNTMIAGAI